MDKFCAIKIFYIAEVTCGTAWGYILGILYVNV